MPNNPDNVTFKEQKSSSNYRYIINFFSNIFLIVKIILARSPIAASNFINKTIPSRIENSSNDRIYSKEPISYTPAESEAQLKKLREEHFLNLNSISAHKNKYINNNNNNINLKINTNHLQIQQANLYKTNQYATNSNSININNNLNAKIQEINNNYNMYNTNAKQNKNQIQIKLNSQVFNPNSKENLIKTSQLQMHQQSHNNPASSNYASNLQPGYANMNSNINKSNIINNINNSRENKQNINIAIQNPNTDNIIKNAYKSTPKTDLKSTKVEKRDFKSSKIERIEKPDSSKYSKEKKENSNYNKIVILSHNYNPSSNLKERVVLTKQNTNKNSRKTSNEKSANKVLSLYTNSNSNINALHNKSGLKTTILSSLNLDKSSTLNMTNTLKNKNCADSVITCNNPSDISALLMTSQNNKNFQIGK